MKTFGCCHLLLVFHYLTDVFGNIPVYGLRTLVTKHAFTSYFMREFINDMVDKPVIIHNIIELSHPRVNFGLGFEITTLSIIAYIVYKSYYESISSIYHKFNKLPEFKKNYRRFQFCIFVLTIVFTKEIENAI
jgi:hypothetical protein